MYNLPKQLLCLILLLPIHLNTITATSCGPVQSREQLVYIVHNVREILISLEEALPHYTWSPVFKELCNDIKNNEISAEASTAISVVNECLTLFENNNSPELEIIEQELKNFLRDIHNGDANLKLDIENAMTRQCGSCSCKNIKYKGTKAFCALLAKELLVRGNTTLNNLLVTGNATFNGLVTFNDGITNGGDATFDDLTVNGTFTTLGPVNIGVNDTADTINIGTGSDNRIVNIGNTNTGSETRIFGNEDVNDGITLSAGGNVRVVPFNITFVTTPFTVNPVGRVGRLTISGLGTAAGATSPNIVINSSAIGTLSAVLVGSIGITGTEDAQMSLKRIVITPGTITLNLRNNGTQNLVSNVNMVFWILN